MASNITCTHRGGTEMDVTSRALTVKIPWWILQKLSPVFMATEKREERAIHSSVWFFAMRSTCDNVLILLS